VIRFLPAKTEKMSVLVITKELSFHSHVRVILAIELFFGRLLSRQRSYHDRERWIFASSGISLPLSIHDAAHGSTGCRVVAVAVAVAAVVNAIHAPLGIVCARINVEQGCGSS
jgi:hypothetical protein